MSKFKVGDKIKVVKAPSMDWYLPRSILGRTGTIKKADVTFWNGMRENGTDVSYPAVLVDIVSFKVYISPDDIELVEESPVLSVFEQNIVHQITDAVIRGEILDSDAAQILRNLGLSLPKPKSKMKRVTISFDVPAGVDSTYAAAEAWINYAYNCPYSISNLTASVKEVK